MTLFLVLMAAGVLFVLLVPVRLRFGWALSLALAAFVLLPAGSIQAGAIESIAGILLGLAYIAVAIITSLRKMSVVAPVWMALLILALGEASAALNAQPNTFAMVAALAGPAAFILAVSLRRAEVKVVLVATIVLASAEAALYLYESFVARAPLFAAEAYETHPIFDEAIRGQGTLGHPLVAALVAIGGIIAVLHMQGPVVLRVLLIAGLAGGVVATGSSSAILACGFCVVVGFIVSGSARSRVAKVAVAVAILAFVLGGALVPSALTNDIGGTNSTHRLNSIIAIPRLITDRTFGEALFGSGWGSAQTLYERNVLINDGFFAIDNQFTTILAASGIVGLGAFVVLLTIALVRTRGVLRVGILTFVIMFASFDVLSWVATASIFYVFVGVGLIRGARLPLLEHADTQFAGSSRRVRYEPRA